MKPKIKICPDCSLEQGAKTKTCKKCGHKFVFNKNKWEEIKKWRELRPGHQFLLKKGSRGPYYMNGDIKILMGYRGLFTVKSLEHNGIVAHGGNEGYAFIYMGPTKFIEDTSIYRRKYILYKKI